MEHEFSGARKHPKKPVSSICSKPFLVSASGIRGCLSVNGIDKCKRDSGMNCIRSPEIFLPFALFRFEQRSHFQRIYKGTQGKTHCTVIQLSTLKIPKP